MKPRLDSARPTEDDSLIWHRVTNRFTFVTGIPWASVWKTANESDRRDADLMHTRTHRIAFGCAVCWQNIAHEACTVDHEIRMRRPFPKGSLGEFLKGNLT